MVSTLVSGILDWGIAMEVESFAKRAGRWYGGQTQAVRAVVALGGVAVVLGIVYFLGNLIGDSVGGILVIVFAFVAYFFPSFVADRRDVANKGSVRVINLFLGWTLVGWVVALAMAMAGPSGSQKIRPVAASHTISASSTDTRPCPFCAEDIKKAAIVCKHCGRDVSPV